MSIYQKGKVRQDTQAVTQQAKSQPEPKVSAPYKQPDSPNEGPGEIKATTNALRKASIISSSRLFQHNPKNVTLYFDTQKKINQTFDFAQKTENITLKNRLTGEIGELTTEKTLYALKGNAKIKLYESKVGGGRNNGIDHVASKGDHFFAIESKATRSGNKLTLTKTISQGQQMSPEWIQFKISEMQASPATAQTATLLSNQPYTKYISGIDVNYSNQTVRLVTDPERYATLPADVHRFDPAHSASHAKMNTMKAINNLGKLATYAAFALDGAQVLGQLHHDLKKNDGAFGGTLRLVLEKGAGYALSISAVSGLNVCTSFTAIAVSTVVATQSYKLGESAGSSLSDLTGLPPLSEAQREENLRKGMDIIAGETGAALFNMLNVASDVLSEGLSSGCKLLNDTLPFEVCTPEPTALPQPEKHQPELSPAEANSEQMKTLGFHARRLEIMRSQAEKKGAPLHTEAALTTDERHRRTSNQPLLTTSEDDPAYEAPKLTP